MGRSRTYDRNEVLTKAMNLFWAKGYEGTHLQELVSVTGLNRFSLYKEFNGKDGIFSESLDKYLTDAKNHYAPLLATPLGLQNIYNYFESVHFPKDYNGCFAVNCLTEQNIINTSEFIKVKTFFKEIEKAYLNNLKAAKKNKEIPKGKDILALSKFLLSLDFGLAIFGVISKKKSDRVIVTSQLKGLLT